MVHVKVEFLSNIPVRTLTLRLGNVFLLVFFIMLFFSAWWQTIWNYFHRRRFIMMWHAFFSFFCTYNHSELIPILLVICLFYCSTLIKHIKIHSNVTTYRRFVFIKNGVLRLWCFETCHNWAYQITWLLIVHSLGHTSFLKF